MSERAFIPIWAEHKIKWKGGDIAEKAENAALYGMYKAAQFFMEHVKEKIGVEGDGVPSDPGQPPHKQTGNLYNNVSLVVNKNEKAVAVQIDPEKAPYWYYLEFGTKHMDARPFWRVSKAETMAGMKLIAAMESTRKWNTSGFGLDIKTIEPTISQIAKKAQGIKEKGENDKPGFFGAAKKAIGSLVNRIKSFRKR